MFWITRWKIYFDDLVLTFISVFFRYIYVTFVRLFSLWYVQTAFALWPMRTSVRPSLLFTILLSRTSSLQENSFIPRCFEHGFTGNVQLSFEKHCNESSARHTLWFSNQEMRGEHLDLHTVATGREMVRGNWYFEESQVNTTELTATWLAQLVGRQTWFTSRLDQQPAWSYQLF